jgi:arabinose-5-phosphate isomerase
MEKYFKNALENLEYALKTFDRSEEFYNILLNAVNTNSRIIISALGKNVSVSEKVVGTLQSLSIKSDFMHTNSAFHGDIGKIDDNDLVLILSKSGETDETIVLIEHLMQYNFQVVGLTFASDCSRMSNLLKHNNFFLKIKNEGDKWNLIPNNSAMIFLTVLQSVVNRLIFDLSLNIEVIKKNHPGGYIGKKVNGE